jgi:uncharacterized membrane protein
MANRDVAARCGLGEQELNAAFENVSEMAPGASTKAGSCTLTRTAGKERVLVVITNSGRAVPQ